MPSASELVSNWCKDLQVSRDLTDAKESLRVLELASEILASGVPIDDFKEACYGDELGKNAAPPVMLSAIQSAASKLKMKEVEKFHIACVFAMYGEQNRIQTKAGHENGQDFLRMKVRQLEWLFDGESCEKTWEIIAVDDGCPHNSKGLARMRVEVEGYKNVRVLDLEDTVRNRVPFFVERGITAGCKESRKGGAILYGLYMTAAEAAAASDPAVPHLVMYTDADLSTDMSLVGELAYGSTKSRISMGARYGAPGTFLVKPPDHGAVGHPQSHYEQPNMMKIVFRQYLRTRLLPMLEGIYDTQCAFKCFHSTDLFPILREVRSIGADFDMELLLCAITHYRNRGTTDIIAVFPTLFTEDFAESNFMASSSDPDKPYKTYAGMTDALIAMHEQYVPADSDEHARAVDLIEFGKKLDWEAYKRMILSLESKLGPTLFDYDFGLDNLKEAAGVFKKARAMPN